MSVGRFILVGAIAGVALAVGLYAYLCLYVFPAVRAVAVFGVRQ